MVYRLDVPTASTTAPPVGTVGPEGFPTAGVPGVTPASVIDPYFNYALCEEIRNVVVKMGLTPTKGDTTQLWQALQKMMPAASTFFDYADANLTADATITPTAYETIVTCANGSAITLTIDAGSIKNQALTILGSGAATVDVASGGPNFRLPNGVAVTSWTIPAAYAAGVRMIWDGTTYRVCPFGGATEVVRYITQSGTYTPTPGTKAILVEVVGGGGSGAGCTGATSPNVTQGSGGAAGAMGISYLTSGFSGVAVTIGAGGAAPGAGANNGNPGGTSSFGSLVTAPGGGGGLYNGGGAGGSAGGSCSAATGGNLLNIPGEQGGMGMGDTNNSWSDNYGGSTRYGTGGGAVLVASNGQPGSGYGAGGGGARGYGASSSTLFTGGYGTPGVVVIREFM